MVEWPPLNKIIWDKISNKRSLLAYDDDDIVSCTANIGLCVLQLLKLSIGALLDSLTQGSPKELKVVINSQDTLSSGGKPTNSLALMMTEARSKDTTRLNFKSKVPIDVVTTFQNEYQAALNKEQFLESYYANTKPSIDNQIKAFVVQFLNDKKFWYTEREKPNACKAIKVFVDLLKFIHIHHSVLSKQQKTKFKKTLLDDIQYSVFAKAKATQPKYISQESIVKNIQKDYECFDLWPDSYRKELGNDRGRKRKGESILNEVENAVDVLETYKIYLQSQSVRMSSISNPVSGARVSELNAKLKLWTMSKYNSCPVDKISIDELFLISYL